MHIVRRIFVALLAFILPFLLFLTALGFGITRTIGNPDNVKRVIADSGVYQNIIPATLEQASKQSKNASVSLVDPTVKKAAAQTLTPDFLQSSTENVISGVYRWLEGKVPQPDFRIDFGSKKAEFATLVADHAKQLAASLPPCSYAQTEQMAAKGSSFDVFSATCLPIGISPANVATTVKSELLSNQNFLKDPVVTANNFRNSSSNKSVFSDQFSQAPKFYQWAKRSPFILSLLCLLVIAGIVFVSISRRKGLKRVGITLIIGGVVMLIFAWGLNYGITKKALPKINIDNKVLQGDIKSLATNLTHSLSKNYWIIGGVYVVLGAGAVAGAWKYRRTPALADADDKPSAERTTPKADENTDEKKANEPKELKPKQNIKIK